MRYGSRFISLLLGVFVVFAVLALRAPAVHAAGVVPPGCTTINGIIVCSDNTGADGNPLPSGCSLIGGVTVCGDGSVGDSGSVCVQVPSTGQQSCIDSGGSLSSGPIPGLGKGFGKVSGMPAQTTGTGWLSRLTGWFAYAVNATFSAIAKLLHDLVVFLLGAVMAVVSMAIRALPVPDWLGNYNMGSMLGAAGPVAGFFMSHLNVAAALGLIGAAYGFRLLRKFLTLFQW